MSWPAMTRLGRRARRRFAEFVFTQAAARDIFLVIYRGGERRRWVNLVRQIKREREFLLSAGEACQILAAVKATAHVPGDLAEVGVAYGASAKLIARAAGARTLHLFDTFGGLPVPGHHDDVRLFSEGDFSSEITDVKAYLSGLPVEFHQGLFPATAEPVRNHRFSFVHLDVDLYEGTLAGLQFFYPRLSPGGILITHDYRYSPGVDRAFTEFFQDKPEPVIEMTGYQAMMVKLA